MASAVPTQQPDPMPSTSTSTPTLDENDDAQSLSTVHEDDSGSTPTSNHAVGSEAYKADFLKVCYERGQSAAGAKSAWERFCKAWDAAGASEGGVTESPATSAEGGAAEPSTPGPDVNALANGLGKLTFEDNIPPRTTPVTPSPPTDLASSSSAPSPPTSPTPPPTRRTSLIRKISKKVTQPFKSKKDTPDAATPGRLRRSAPIRPYSKPAQGLDGLAQQPSAPSSSSTTWIVPDAQDVTSPIGMGFGARQLGGIDLGQNGWVGREMVESEDFTWQEYLESVGLEAILDCYPSPASDFSDQGRQATSVDYSMTSGQPAELTFVLPPLPADGFLLNLPNNDTFSATSSPAPLSPLSPLSNSPSAVDTDQSFPSPDSGSGSDAFSPTPSVPSTDSSSPGASPAPPQPKKKRANLKSNSVSHPPSAAQAANAVLDADLKLQFRRNFECRERAAAGLRASGHYHGDPKTFFKAAADHSFKYHGPNSLTRWDTIKNEYQWFAAENKYKCRHCALERPKGHGIYQPKPPGKFNYANIITRAHEHIAKKHPEVKIAPLITITVSAAVPVASTSASPTAVEMEASPSPFAQGFGYDAYPGDILVQV
ncbi:hypothetical protein RQP46_007408 [Phenoliferia psychrophenolica]